MRLDIPHKGVAARAGPVDSCWGHGISRRWKHASLMNAKGLALDRGMSGEIWPARHMRPRKQGCRKERLMTSTSLSYWGSACSPGVPHKCQEAAITVTQLPVTLTPGCELGCEIFKMRLNYADSTFEMESTWCGFHLHWQDPTQN